MYLVKCNVFTQFKVQKHIIFHIMYIIVAPLCSAFLKCVNFYKSSFWEARRALIGQLSSALWLAEIQACDRNITTLTVLWCRVPARRHKNNKTHFKRSIFSSIGDINTDYNDLYCLFTRRVAYRATET